MWSMLSAFYNVRTIYFLVDCSETMTGRPIETIYKTINEFLDDVKSSPSGLEADIKFSLITFNNIAEQIIPPTSIFDFSMPRLRLWGEKNIGGAICFLQDCIDLEQRTDKKNRPIVILFTDDKPLADVDVFSQAKLDILSLPLFTFIAWTTIKDSFSHSSNNTYLKDITQYVTDGEAIDIIGIINGVFYMRDDGTLEQAIDADWRSINFPMLKMIGSFGGVHTIYLLLDCSESMRGKPAEYMCEVIESFIPFMNSDEPLSVSIITFNDTAQETMHFDITSNTTAYPMLKSRFMPTLNLGGKKCLGEALRVLRCLVETEAKNSSKKHERPLVILFTDGSYPTDIDTFSQETKNILSLQLFTFLVWTASSNADTTYLKKLSQYILKGASHWKLLNKINGLLDFYFDAPINAHDFASWKYNNAVQNTSFPHETTMVCPPKTAGNIIIPADKDNLYKKGEISMSSLIRRLPVYLLVDCSGSMSGEPIEAVRQGIDTLVSELSSEPQALETAYLSVITFASTAQQVVPLTDLMSFTPPTINASGTTALGGALQVLRDCINREVRKNSAEQKGDWKPLVFILTDGCPTDTDVFDQEVQNVPNMKTACIVACAAGSSADTSYLKRITNNVLMMNNLTPGDMAQFFAWVSGSIVGASKSLDAKPGAPINLAPPPTGFIVVP